MTLRSSVKVRAIKKYKEHYWASEASPTLGCSIELSRDIYIYVCMSTIVYGKPIQKICMAGPNMRMLKKSVFGKCSL